MTACPFCSAELPPAPAGGRVVCPRCGESVAAPATVVVNAPYISARGQADATPTVPLRALWPLALLGLVMLVAVGAITLYAIFGNPRRTEAPPVPPPRPAAPTVRLPAEAARVPGLGYLPRDVNAVAALQLGAVSDEAARAGKSGRDLLLEAGVPAEVFGVLADTGLSLDSLDAAVLGAMLASGDLVPRAVLVVTGRGPLGDLAGLRTRLKARPAPGRSGVEQGELRGLPLFVAVPVEDTLILATTLADVPPPGRPRPWGFAEPFAPAIGQLSPRPFGYAVTARVPWDKLPLLALATQTKPPRVKLPESDAANLGALAAELKLAPTLTVAAKYERLRGDGAGWREWGK